MPPNLTQESLKTSVCPAVFGMRDDAATRASSPMRMTTHVFRSGLRQIARADADWTRLGEAAV
jgi:hypothetical protein